MTPPPDATVRLLTWNIWGQFGDWEARQPGIEATLAAFDPDVIVLQETWPAQAERLAERLGRHVAASIHPGSGDPALLGLAVLSRLEIQGHEAVNLPPGDAPDEHRQALRADVRTDHGTLSVTTTHLNHRLDHSAIRSAQVRTVLDLVTAAPASPLPPVVAGDFNAVPDADEIRMLTGRTVPPVPGLVFHEAWEAARGDGFAWSRANPEAARTWEPDARIDYVFVGYQPRRHGRVRHVEAVPGQQAGGVWPSDHFAVLAEIDASP